MRKIGKIRTSTVSIKGKHPHKHTIITANAKLCIFKKLVDEIKQSLFTPQRGESLDGLKTHISKQLIVTRGFIDCIVTARSNDRLVIRRVYDRFRAHLRNIIANYLQWHRT